MSVETVENAVAGIRNRVHSRCIVCGSANAKGLHLKSDVADDGSVKATFQCNRVFEGYPGVLHGGVISSILDGAMTNCMFARGQVTLTAQLTTRFRNPVVTQMEATVVARVTRSSHPLYLLEAEITQDGQVKAAAKGKFYEQPGLVDLTEQFS
jgi:acyl-coenzyme A thioesterase PaaI-like protein